jgi:hypothetical protein
VADAREVFLRSERKYFTNAAAARIRTTITSSKNRPLPHIIQPMPFIVIKEQSGITSLLCFTSSR